MAGMALAPIVDAVRENGWITTEDVLDLRRAIYHDGIIDAAEARALFALNAACVEAAPAWSVLFVEALTDHIVHQAEPRGYVSRANADWLIGEISRDGVVETSRELELLIKLMEAGRDVPRNLVAFALAQVSHAVLNERGVLVRGGALVPGVIGEPEVMVLRRILYAAGGDGSIAITRTEAEMLFDLNDATIEARNAPAWSDLFVKAIACHLMAAEGFRVPPRAEALRRSEWVESACGLDWGGPTGKGFRAALGGGLKTLFGASLGERVEAAYAERNGAFAADAASAERLDRDEAMWVVDRIGRDGVVHENERALLAFLRDESPVVDPHLQALIERAA